MNADDIKQKSFISSVFNRRRLKMKEKKGILLAVTGSGLYGLMPFFARFIYKNGGNAMTLCVHRYVFSVMFLLNILLVNLFFIFIILITTMSSIMLLSGEI